MGRPITIPVDDCQPSQLLLSAEKLRGVLGWFDPDDPVYDPIEVAPADDLPIDGVAAPYVSIDGHTRAFVAACCGADEVRARGRRTSTRLGCTPGASTGVSRRA